MITIPAEALFDVLQKGEAQFTDYDDYARYKITIGKRNETVDLSYPEGTVYYITKASFMELLLNRVFVCEEYELKIGL